MVATRNLGEEMLTYSLRENTCSRDLCWHTLHWDASRYPYPNSHIWAHCCYLMLQASFFIFHIFLLPSVQLIWLKWNHFQFSSKESGTVFARGAFYLDAVHWSLDGQVTGGKSRLSRPQTGIMSWQGLCAGPTRSWLLIMTVSGGVGFFRLHRII